ncbi:hypothetical protein [Micromonospora chalcea]|uniref:hypothetical protein n=1 Tax=Micromonospora chalcea TaxID=1874 RepID=UPI0038F5D1B4
MVLDVGGVEVGADPAQDLRPPAAALVEPLPVAGPAEPEVLLVRPPGVQLRRHLGGEPFGEQGVRHAVLGPVADRGAAVVHHVRGLVPYQQVEILGRAELFHGEEERVPAVQLTGPAVGLVAPDQHHALDRPAVAGPAQRVRHRRDAAGQQRAYRLGSCRQLGGAVAEPVQGGGHAGCVGPAAVAAQRPDHVRVPGQVAGGPRRAGPFGAGQEVGHQVTDEQQAGGRHPHDAARPRRGGQHHDGTGTAPHLKEVFSKLPFDARYRHRRTSRYKVRRTGDGSQSPHAVDEE